MMGLQFALLLAGASALVPLPTPVGLPLRCTISPRALAVARYGSSSSKAAKAANAKGPTRRGKSVSKSASTSKATKPAGLFGRKPVVDPAPNPATPARGLFGRKAEPPPPPPPAKPAGLFGFGGSPSAARAPATQRRGGRGKPPPPSDPRSAQADAKAQRVAMRKAGLDVLKVMAQFSQEKEQRRKEREQRRTAAAAAPISAGSRGTAPFFKFSMPKLQLPTVSVPGIAAPPPPPPPPPPPSPPQRQEAERGAGVGLVGGLTGLVSTYAELAVVRTQLAFKERRDAATAAAAAAASDLASAPSRAAAAAAAAAASAREAAVAALGEAVRKAQDAFRDAEDTVEKTVKAQLAAAESRVDSLTSQARDRRDNL